MSIALGSSGPDVGAAQQLLLEAGESIDVDELNQQVFGTSSHLALLDFQASHVDPLGKPLAQDGVIGPSTLAALKDPQPITSGAGFKAPGWNPTPGIGDAAAVCQVAIGEIGTLEVPSGSNRGPKVDQYEGPAWLGQPWCALFASWCWGHIGKPSPFGIKASALKLRDWGLSNGAILPTIAPAQPGDLAIMLRAGGRGHVEIIVSAEAAGLPLSLVGGNVGNAVRGTVRSRETFTAIVRPVR